MNMNIDYNELKSRITLNTIEEIRDAELNITEILTPWRTVWAKLEVKTATDDDTPSGIRPELRYKITIRYDKKILERKLAITSGTKRLYTTAPPYKDGNYIVFNATEQVEKGI